MEVADFEMLLDKIPTLIIEAQIRQAGELDSFPCKLSNADKKNSNQLDKESDQDLMKIDRRLRNCESARRSRKRKLDQLKNYGTLFE